MLGPEFKTPEVRGKKQADEGTPVVQSSPVSWRGTDEPATREFNTHATLQFIAGEDYSRPRHSGNSMYKSAATLANIFLPADQQVTSHQLFNYFNGTKRGDRQIGKYRGKLRTTHFRPYVTTVESACHGIFSKASQEPANVDWESICIVRSAATSAVSQWQTRLTETTTSTECNFGMAEIYKHVQGSPRPYKASITVIWILPISTRQTGPFLAVVGCFLS